MWRVVCSGDATPPPSHRTTPAPATHDNHSDGDDGSGIRLTYWVSATSGDDGATGRTPTAAWRTLPRVLRALEARPPLSTAAERAVVNLQGTFRLSSPLRLKSVHSGVTFRPAPGAEGQVKISGGVDLSKLEWRHSHTAHSRGSSESDTPVQIWSTQVPSGLVPARFESLFAGGRRQVRMRARFSQLALMSLLKCGLLFAVIV
jgi:hypothetical protein